MHYTSNDTSNDEWLCMKCWILHVMHGNKFYSLSLSLSSINERHRWRHNCYPNHGSFHLTLRNDGMSHVFVRRNIENVSAWDKQRVNMGWIRVVMYRELWQFGTAHTVTTEHDLQPIISWPLTKLWMMACQRYKTRRLWLTRALVITLYSWEYHCLWLTVEACKHSVME